MGMLRSLLIAAMTLSIGCSFLFVGRPTPGTEKTLPDCTRSAIAPVIDVAVGAGSLAFGLAVASEKSCPVETCALKGAVVTVSLVTAAVAGLSSIWGFVQTSRCNARIDAWCAEHAGCAGRTPKGEAGAR